MTTYYVATLAHNVLVDAASDDEARSLGEVALQELYADLQDGHAADAPINILTVRPATDEEVELQRFHNEMAAREAGARGG
jgi:hypothetical protein